MNYQVIIEGQTIPVPEEIGGSDEAVKRALAPFYPEAANAMITRITKEETTTITVVKRAGSKGAGLHPRKAGVQALITCKGGKNPAIELYEEIAAREAEGTIDLAEMLEMDGRIEKAIEEGVGHAKAVKAAAERLAQSRPVAAPVMVAGF